MTFIYGPCGRHGVYEDTCWVCEAIAPIQELLDQHLKDARTAVEAAGRYHTAEDARSVYLRYVEGTERLVREISKIEMQAPPPRLVVDLPGPR